MTEWYLGTMGFGYKQWQGVFYPAGLPARNQLAYYSERFDAVEMDSTFYATPALEIVERWTAVTPPGFKICPKTPRAITHELRLAGAQEPMRLFLQAMQTLGDKLGAILLQLPPDFTFHDVGALIEFLPLLPAEQQFAIEFRHRSWERPETAVLLEQRRLCWVAADYIYMPKKVHRTADFLYLRFLGRHGQYADKDREVVDKTAVLEQWRAQLDPHLQDAHTVYGFFNNDYAGYSPATCNRFKEIVGVETKEIRPYQQGRLF